MSDLPEFFTETWRVCSGRGKKIFRCEECRGEITKGEKYLAISGKWDGEMGEYRFHGICKEISDAQRVSLRATGLRWEDMPAFGEMVEWAGEDVVKTGLPPLYWPKGVDVCVQALSEYVALSKRERKKSPASVASAWQGGIL